MNSYLFIYIVVSICLAYVLRHQLNMIRLMSSKKDLKLREKIAKKQKQLELYIKLCPIWPMLLLKELYDEIKERRQG